MVKNVGPGTGSQLLLFSFEKMFVSTFVEINRSNPPSRHLEHLKSDAGIGLYNLSMKIDLLTKQDLIDVLHEFKTTLVQELLDKLAQGGSSGAPRWIQTKEVMKTLGCCESTLRNYRKSGRLKPTRLGAILYYNKAEVDGLIQSHHI